MKKTDFTALIAAVCIAVSSQAFTACSNSSDSGSSGPIWREKNAALDDQAAAKWSALAGNYDVTKVVRTDKNWDYTSDSDKKTAKITPSGIVFYDEGGDETDYHQYHSYWYDEYTVPKSYGPCSAESALAFYLEHGGDSEVMIQNALNAASNGDPCLAEYVQYTDKKYNNNSTYPDIFVLRDAGGGAVEFINGVTYILQKKGSGGGSGGGGSLSFSLEGAWKPSDALSGNWISLDSGGTFRVFKNGTKVSTYTDVHWSLSGSRLTVGCKVDANTTVTEDFDVSGSSSSMKWSVVKTVSKVGAETTPDNSPSNSKLILIFFNRNAKECTFVPN